MRAERRSGAALVLARIGPAFFAVAAAAALWRLHRLRYARVWVDESDNVVNGWLLSEGHRLYDTLFSHHTPLAYMAAHGVALLSPSDDLAHFRLVPALAYVAAGLAFVGAACARDAADRGWIAGAVFVVAAALFAPAFGGTLLLTDVLWGVAFVAFATTLWIPLCLGRAPGRAQAAIGGAALALWVSGSLVTVYPLLATSVLLAVLCAASARHRRASLDALRPALAGALAIAALQAAWLTWRGDWAGFVEQGILFNFRYYGPSQGFEGGAGPWSVFVAGLREAGGEIAHALVAPQRDALSSWLAWPVVLACVGLGWHVARSLEGGPARRAVAFVLAVLAQAVVLGSLRLRGDGIHAAPHHLWTLGACALVLCLLGDRARLAIAAGVVAAGGVLLAVSPAALRFDVNPSGLEHAIPQALSSFHYVRQHTEPGDRFLALNVEPLAYLVARRQPAMGAVFYVPWQAAWERDRGVPDSCAVVRADPPPFFYYAPLPIHGRPWSSFGACFDEILRDLYEPVTALGIRSLWKLRDPAQREDALGGVQ